MCIDITKFRRFSVDAGAESWYYVFDDETRTNLKSSGESIVARNGTAVQTPPEDAPAGDAGQQKPQESPEDVQPPQDSAGADVVLPDGYVGLSDAAGARQRKNDPYQSLRALVGKLVVFTTLSIASLDAKTGAGTVKVLEIDGGTARETGEPIDITIPRAAIKTLVAASKNANGRKLTARVVATKRGVALR